MEDRIDSGLEHPGTGASKVSGVSGYSGKRADSNAPSGYAGGQSDRESAYGGGGAYGGHTSNSNQSQKPAYHNPNGNTFTHHGHGNSQASQPSNGRTPSNYSNLGQQRTPAAQYAGVYSSAGDRDSTQRGNTGSRGSHGNVGDLGGNVDGLPGSRGEDKGVSGFSMNGYVSDASARSQNSLSRGTGAGPLVPV